MGEIDAETQSFFTTTTTLLGYLMLGIIGKINDTVGRLTGSSRFIEEM